MQKITERMFKMHLQKPLQTYVLCWHKPHLGYNTTLIWSLQCNQAFWSFRTDWQPSVFFTSKEMPLKLSQSPPANATHTKIDKALWRSECLTESLGKILGRFDVRNCSKINNVFWVLNGLSMVNACLRQLQPHNPSYCRGDWRLCPKSRCFSLMGCTPECFSGLPAETLRERWPAWIPASHLIQSIGRLRVHVASWRFGRPRPAFSLSPKPNTV